MRSGDPGTQVAQTVRFPRFYERLPSRLAFGAFLVKDHALLRVWHTRAFQTIGFVDSIGPWAPSTTKVYTIIALFECAFQKRVFSPTHNIVHSNWGL